MNESENRRSPEDEFLLMVSEMEEQYEQGKAASRKGKKVLNAVVAVLVVVVAAACAGYILASSGIYDARASTIVNANEQDVQARLNEEVEKGMLTISVANTFDVEGGRAVARDHEGTEISVLDNVEENHMDMKYTMYLEDEDTILFESDLIRPGESIQSPELENLPKPGTYGVKVVAQGYDPVSHAANGGTVAANVTMSVE